MAYSLHARQEKNWNSERKEWLLKMKKSHFRLAAVRIVWYNDFMEVFWQRNF